MGAFAQLLGGKLPASAETLVQVFAATQGFLLLQEHLARLGRHVSRELCTSQTH